MHHYASEQAVVTRSESHNAGVANYGTDSPIALRIPHRVFWNTRSGASKRMNIRRRVVAAFDRPAMKQAHHPRLLGIRNYREGEHALARVVFVTRLGVRHDLDRVGVIHKPKAFDAEAECTEARKRIRQLNGLVESTRCVDLDAVGSRYPNRKADIAQAFGGLEIDQNIKAVTRTQGRGRAIGSVTELDILQLQWLRCYAISFLRFRRCGSVQLRMAQRCRCGERRLFQLCFSQLNGLSVL